MFDPNIFLLNFSNSVLAQYNTKPTTPHANFRQLAIVC